MPLILFCCARHGKASSGRSTGSAFNRRFSPLVQKLKTLLEEKYIPSATVAVQVVEFGSQPISVIGAVMRPGTIGASNNMTLIQAITQAGGLSQGFGRELYILRTGQNGLTEQLTIDIKELMESGNPDLIR